MEQPETRIHSFVIRLWQEETANDTNSTRWRGHITHIPGDERHYIQELDEIKQFILPYLTNKDADSKL